MPPIDTTYQPGADEQFWLQIGHPDIEGSAVCTREAFGSVHAAKGWEVQAELGWATAPPEKLNLAVDLESHTKGELQAVASELGLDTSGSKADLIERISAAPVAGG